MNSRLVDAIAQIVLAMSAEERQLFEQIIDSASPLKPSLNSSDKTQNEQISSKKNNQASPAQKSEAALSKDAQVAQIAQQMQDFEEKHAMPLSPLPDDQWTL